MAALHCTCRFVNARFETGIQHRRKTEPQSVASTSGEVESHCVSTKDRPSFCAHNQYLVSLDGPATASALFTEIAMYPFLMNDFLNKARHPLRGNNIIRFTTSEPSSFDRGISKTNTDNTTKQNIPVVTPSLTNSDRTSLRGQSTQRRGRYHEREPSSNP